MVEQLPVKELAGYLTSFVRESHGIIKIKDLTDSTYAYSQLSWQREKGGTIADCISSLHVTPFIIHVDERYWSDADPIDRWAIMFHELGHCACGLDHTTEQGSEWLTDLLEAHGFKTYHARKFPDGCQDSIMAWNVPHKRCVVVHRDEYLGDLFRRCKRPIRLAILPE